jgi:hypothetical protein
MAVHELLLQLFGLQRFNHDRPRVLPRFDRSRVYHWVKLPLVKDILVEAPLVVRIFVMVSEDPDEVEVPVRVEVLHCRQLLESVCRFLGLLHCLEEIRLSFC